MHLSSGCVRSTKQVPQLLHCSHSRRQLFSWQSNVCLRPRAPPGYDHRVTRCYSSLGMNFAASQSLVIATATAATALLCVTWGMQRLKRTAETFATYTRFNNDVLSRLPTVHEPYHVSVWLSNPHVETILASWYRNNPGVTYKRELLTMADGGTVAVDYEDVKPEQELPSDCPVVLILPGLTGGSHDKYIQHVVINLRKAGFRGVVFNSRGTSDSPVTTPQFYSASFTGDMRQVVSHVSQKYNQSVLFAMGYSLGGNILVRYLGEEGPKTPIQAAVSLCNPFNLPVSNANFTKGFNRIYDLNLARSLRTIYSQHAHLFEGIGGEFQPDLAAKAKTIEQFDDAITRVSFGWPSVSAYYEGSSSALSIPQVSVPLLCIQAKNDPIAPNAAIPYEAIQKNPNCILIVTPTGGHLGWMSGKDGPFGAPWTDEVVVEYFTAIMAEKYQQQVAGNASQTLTAK